MKYYTYADFKEEADDHGGRDCRKFSEDRIIMTASEFYKHTGLRKRSPDHENKYPFFPNLLDVYSSQLIGLSWMIKDRILAGDGLPLIKKNGVWVRALVVNDGVAGVSEWAKEASKKLVEIHQDLAKDESLNPSGKVFHSSTYAGLRRYAGTMEWANPTPGLDVKRIPELRDIHKDKNVYVRILTAGEDVVRIRT